MACLFTTNKMLNNANPTKGKLIVLYGINNLGKTTQAKILVEKLKKEGFEAEYIKYPLYNLSPSGIILNDYLRLGNSYRLTPREAQIMYVINRTQYEPELTKKINSGVIIVAEDYIGTGLAWGMGADIDENFLKHINTHLLKEDLAILMDGQRFSAAIEKNHEHESNDELINKVKLTHLKLANEHNWPIVNANNDIETVHADIWKHVEQLMREPKKNLHELIKKTYPEKNIDEVNIFYLNKSDDENPAGLSDGQKKEEIENKFELQINKVMPDAKLPTRAHDTDAGLDLYANENRRLEQGDIATVGTGISMAIPNDCAGLIWDKSGLAGKGLKTAGGVIDSGYRGEIKIVIINLSKNVVSIEKGQKIAQMLIQKIATPTMREVKFLPETKRGQNGFGSTGLM